MQTSLNVPGWRCDELGFIRAPAQLAPRFPALFRNEREKDGDGDGVSSKLRFPLVANRATL
jgi:hypothetical protein